MGIFAAVQFCLELAVGRKVVCRNRRALAVIDNGGGGLALSSH